MKMKISFSVWILAAFLAVNTCAASEDSVQQDARAIEVLKSMSAYAASLDRVAIAGITFTDARLGAGLMVANSDEVEMIIDRPGSMYISSFDGVAKKEIYFHDGMLTVYGSEKKYYAQASIPKEIEAALEFALEELELEAPLMDLIYQDVSTHLIGSQETILYLTDKARVAGTDCHHIAIRGPEADLQLWVEEGDRPVPRKIMITSKWEGGAPRFTANLVWVPEPEIDQKTFIFEAPEGSTNIGFVESHRSEGE